MPETRQTFTLSASGNLATGIADRWEAPFAGEVVGVAAVVGTAPTGASAILDLKKNGTSMFTTTGNRPTILAGATETATEPSAKPDTVTFVAGDTIALDVIQVGSTVAGADADVTVVYVTA